MKHVNKYLSLALALVLCLSLAACGESNEDYGDDGSDYNLYGVPDSFEGLVKDSEQMANLYIYGGAWTGEDGSTLIVANNDEGDEVRFALYDIDEELTASGFIQFVPEYDYDYFYNEHDGVAYRSWFDEVGALYVAEFGTFTQMTGDAPGENTGDIDFEMMAGTWYLDAEAYAPSILVLDENGGWNEELKLPFWCGNWNGDPMSITSGPGIPICNFIDFTNFKNMGIKFELCIPESNPWSSAAMQVIFTSAEVCANDSWQNNTYIHTDKGLCRGIYRPWEASGSFHTSGKWITVTIPFSEFVYNADGTKGSVPLQSPNDFASLIIWPWDGGVAGTACTPIFRIDNIRAVPVK